MDDLRRYPIAGERILSPRFFSSHVSQHRGIVDGGAVTVFGCKFTFTDAAPVAGIEVQIEAQRGYAVVVADLLAHEAALAAQQEATRLAEDEERNRKADEARTAAEAFNTALRLPFKWSSANRAHMAGLRQHSSGTGDFASTVTHIRCDEAIWWGRLKRKADQLLCSTSDGRMGLIDDKRRDGAGLAYDAAITCKACLVAAEGWKGQAATA